MKEFKLTNTAEFKGYINKQDITNVDDGFLVTGSQNVLSTDEGWIGTRQGYTLVGAADTTLEPQTGEASWKTARGDEVLLRARNDASNNGTIEFYTSELDVWTELINSVGTGTFNWTTYYDTTENQDALLFVVGNDNIYYWSGGITTFASATSNTITKEGTTSWSEEGFILSGTTQVTIDGTVYTYTGGETTTTLTGVTPDPTSAGHSAGAVAFQTVRTQANTPAANVNNDLIGNHRNAIYIGNLQRRVVNFSVVGDYTDFTTVSSPRVIGESGSFTLNETPTAIIEQEDTLYFSTFNQWYQVNITLSDDLQNESIVIQLLKSSPRGGAINQASVFKAKNDIIYISNEPTINSLGRVEDIDTPQSKDLSDPIKLELESYDTTNASGKFWLNNLYFAFPVENKVLVYNIEKGFWEAPQVLPVRVMSVFEGNLIGHSSGNVESYQLFDGTNDNGLAMHARAVFSYLNYGNRHHKKNFVPWFTEGYITNNTDLKLKLNYDYKGAEQVQEFTIEGDDTSIIFAPAQDQGLGKVPLGHEPLGSTQLSPDDLRKFRVIKTTYKTDFYEIQAEYSSNAIDQRWFLLAHGGAVQLSKADNSEITQ